jgi:hypothetical protein
VDLWVDVVMPVLRDAGTYSYNTEAQWIQYFGGTAGHNTVQFDDRDQMPRLSRFLIGEWLRTEQLEPIHSASCRLYRQAPDTVIVLGARHHRRVILEDMSVWW